MGLVLAIILVFVVIALGVREIRDQFLPPHGGLNGRSRAPRQGRAARHSKTLATLVEFLNNNALHDPRRKIETPTELPAVEDVILQEMIREMEREYGEEWAWAVAKAGLRLRRVSRGEGTVMELVTSLVRIPYR